MSNSLARKRRANLPTPPSPGMNSPVPSILTQSTQDTGGDRRQMTLPQVLSILDKRLTALEKSTITRQVGDTIIPTAAVDESIKETLDEYESRFDMLAEQINFIKDTIMKLQTFTMEVNKTLLEDRGEIRENDTINFSSLDLSIGQAKAEVVDDDEDEE